MKKVIISTETTCDLPREYIEKNGIRVVNMLYTLDGEDFGGKTGRELDGHAFFERMREGGKTQTAQVTPAEAKEHFLALLQEGDVLHVAFSGALSGTAHNFALAAEELNAEGGEHKVVVVDSRGASLGEGLLVHLVNKKAEQGASLEELAAYTTELRDHICHFFVVDDLNFLYRGGRVSRTAAILGTMLKIKPVLHVDPQGRLIPIQKVMTRKKSLQRLVEWMEEKYVPQETDVFISHGDCPEEAQYVADLVEKKMGLKTQIIHSLGPVIGAHSGPGTVALFFYGKDKIAK